MGLFSKFIATIKGENSFAPADWQDLEGELLASDIGPTLTRELLEAARKVSPAATTTENPDFLM